MKIPYSFDGETLKLGSGEYLTPEEVDAAIQGYWTTGLLVKPNKALVGKPLLFFIILPVYAVA